MFQVATLFVIILAITAPSPSKQSLQQLCHDLRKPSFDPVGFTGLSVTMNYIYLVREEFFRLPYEASNWTKQRMALFDEFTAPGNHKAKRPEQVYPFSGPNPWMKGMFYDMQVGTRDGSRISLNHPSNEIFRIDFGPDDEGFTLWIKLREKTRGGDPDDPDIFQYSHQTQLRSILSARNSEDKFTPAAATGARLSSNYPWHGAWELIWKTTAHGRYDQIIRKPPLSRGFYLSLASSDNRTIAWHRAANRDVPLIDPPASYRPLFPEQPEHFNDFFAKRFGYNLRQKNEHRFHLWDMKRRLVHLFAMPDAVMDKMESDDYYKIPMFGPFPLSSIPMAEYFVCSANEWGPMEVWPDNDPEEIVKPTVKPPVKPHVPKPVPPHVPQSVPDVPSTFPSSDPSISPAGAADDGGSISLEKIPTSTEGQEGKIPWLKIGIWMGGLGLVATILVIALAIRIKRKRTKRQTQTSRQKMGGKNYGKMLKQSSTPVVSSKQTSATTRSELGQKSKTSKTSASTLQKTPTNTSKT